MRAVSNYHRLTDIANKYNTDKGTTYKCAHNYTRIYQDIFNDHITLKNNKDISLLEIGLNRDNTNSIPSLMMYNEYFNGRITIFGFDINRNFKKFDKKNDNINIIIGDQSEPNDLSKLKNRKYTIIIDDGYHASKHQQISFRELFDNVESGGCYIIEDLHYQPFNEGTICKTKHLLMEWKNNNFIETDLMKSVDIERIKNSIARIEFYDSESKLWDPVKLKNALCVIYKI